MRGVLGAALIVCAAAACSSFGSDTGTGTATGTGTVAGTDGGTFSCADHPTATLCDDFEGRTKVDLKWGATDSTAGLSTAPTLDTQAAASGSASAAMEIGALASGQHATSALELDVDAHTDGDVHAEYSLRVDAFGANDSIWLSRIALGGTSAGNRYRVWLYIEHGIYYVVQQGPNTATSDHQKLPIEVKPGEWTRVTYDVSFQSKTITVSIGGSAPAMVPFIQEAIPGALVFSVGIDYAEGPTERAAVHYDDVVLESK